MANAVFGFASSESLTCQYPLAKSRVENQACPLSELSESSMRGSGNASFFRVCVEPAIVRAEACGSVFLGH